jgi:hypothetical protein
MLDFHLSVQPETEKRLKKILNSIKDQEKLALLVSVWKRSLY